MGSLKKPLEEKIFEGFIAREEDGYKFFLNFSDTPEELAQLEKQLLMVIMKKIVKHENPILQQPQRIRGSINFIIREVGRLNKEAGFSCPKSKKCQKMA